MQKLRKTAILLFISALLTQAAFSPGKHFYLAFFSFLPFFLTLENNRHAFLKGFIWGTFYSFFSIYWLSMNVGTYFWLAAFSTLLASLFLALQYGLFAWVFKYIHVRNARLAWIMLPFLWTALEFLRSYGTLGFPFIALGASQAVNTAYLQIADIGGIFFVSFFLILANTSLYRFIKARRKSAFITLILSLMLPFVYGIFMLNATVSNDGSISLRLIQPNIGAEEKWIPANRTPIVNTLTSLSRSTGANSIDAVVWPESAIPLYLRSSSFHRHLVQECANKNNFSIITGALDFYYSESDESIKYANSMFVFEPSEFLNFDHFYDKIHLVPFGEFTPGGKWLEWLNNKDYGQSNFVTRRSFQPLSVTADSICFTPVICYDSVFPQTVRRITQKNAGFLAVITNDVWFGKSRGPYQHAALSVVRAVETRRPVVRCANAGVSMFIDAKGRILASMDLGEKGYLDCRLKISEYRSPYLITGPLFGIIMCFITIVLICLSCLKKSSQSV